ncbi:hypothetical protein LTR91_005536 [Friedmanniomyces endolithicus]|uniref:Uncharacterized protein n=1 Tax=Friedmanniomyces endolithicus TaxID=329885 RepID=A0AAN6JAJ2_9PEZI|nr:hypothetical protein LTR35_008507 [Friedmanniomyces endolithicus]KAK0294742.1 hypothetical protein LTS00_006577 [Friedmanniomyces endolithicus]KAK0322441.1 hypothetical protein LTR82_006400 [Friedmanniomyces endolithicus]KAK0922043.1 hypothetical protein LTR57_008187 [Friedmanniomyces endolithicus]KAK1000965.1 hypothetical protein LTR91_005536 [Friedmanniomyces endolithicus]
MSRAVNKKQALADENFKVQRQAKTFKATIDGNFRLLKAGAKKIVNSKADPEPENVDLLSIIRAQIAMNDHITSGFDESNEKKAVYTEAGQQDDPETMKNVLMAYVEKYNLLLPPLGITQTTLNPKTGLGPHAVQQLTNTSVVTFESTTPKVRAPPGAGTKKRKATAPTLSSTVRSKRKRQLVPDEEVEELTLYNSDFTDEGPSTLKPIKTERTKTTRVKAEPQSDDEANAATASDLEDARNAWEETAKRPATYVDKGTQTKQSYYKSHEADKKKKAIDAATVMYERYRNDLRLVPVDYAIDEHILAYRYDCAVARAASYTTSLPLEGLKPSRWTGYIPLDRAISYYANYTAGRSRSGRN